MTIIGESNYYTPDISELYPGFEFEFYEGLEDEVNNFQWRSAKISTRQSRLKYQPNSSDKEILEDILFDYSYYLDLPDTTRLRVKFLDKDDIISLGFICTESDENKDAGSFSYKFQFEDYTLLYCNWYTWSSNNPEESVLKEDINEWRLVRIKNGDRHVVSIDVKNKSELSKLLKRLNIL
jgi:hypothetical protein